MTYEQELHLSTIKISFDVAVDKKYRDGQEAHGGNLFEMSAIELIDNAIEEAIDQFVYLITLRNKLTPGVKNDR